MSENDDHNYIKYQLVRVQTVESDHFYLSNHYWSLVYGTYIHMPVQSNLHSNSNNNKYYHHHHHHYYSHITILNYFQIVGVK